MATTVRGLTSVRTGGSWQRALLALLIPVLAACGGGSVSPAGSAPPSASPLPAGPTPVSVLSPPVASASPSAGPRPSTDRLEGSWLVSFRTSAGASSGRSIVLDISPTCASGPCTAVVVVHDALTGTGLATGRFAFTGAAFTLTLPSTRKVDCAGTSTIVRSGAVESTVLSLGAYVQQQVGSAAQFVQLAGQRTRSTSPTDAAQAAGCHAEQVSEFATGSPMAYVVPTPTPAGGQATSAPSAQASGGPTGPLALTFNGDQYTSFHVTSNAAVAGSPSFAHGIRISARLGDEATVWWDIALPAGSTCTVLRFAVTGRGTAGSLRSGLWNWSTGAADHPAQVRDAYGTYTQTAPLTGYMDANRTIRGFVDTSSPGGVDWELQRVSFGC